jgi:hypothetical protein
MAAGSHAERHAMVPGGLTCNDSHPQHAFDVEQMWHIKVMLVPKHEC